MVERLAVLGRFISVVLVLAMYACGWGITLSWIRRVNDEEWVKAISIIWIVIHSFLVILWLFWSWLYLI